MSDRILIDSGRINLGDLMKRVTDRTALHKVMAVAGTRAVRDHFAGNADWQKNKFGRPPQFWRRMNRATRAESSQSEAAIVMPVEVAQRYFGGPIRPTGGKKYLTIPASKSSYRRAAQSFDDAMLIFFKHPKGKAQGMIVRKVKQKKKTVQEVLYWLVLGVDQVGEKRVMPTDAELGAAIKPEVEDYIMRGRGNQTASA